MLRGLFLCMPFLLTFVVHNSQAIEIAVGSHVLNSPSISGTAYETIALGQSYTAPLIFPMPVDSVTTPSSISVRQVLSSSFEMAHAFPDGSTPGFSRPDIDYLVIETGTHSFAGATIVAGSISTQEFQSKFDPASDWHMIDYSAAGFGAPPVVLVQIQTDNNETAGNLLTSPSRPWMTVAVESVGASTALVSLERAETTLGSITADETIAYLVVDAGIASSFLDASATNVSFQTVRSADAVTDSCTNVTLALPASTPLGFASQNTRGGIDGGWLRKCSLSNTNFALKVQEDLATDPDVTHTTERAAIFVFSEAFLGTPSDIGFRMEAATASFSMGSLPTLSATTISFAGTFAVAPRVFLLPTNEATGPASLRILNITTTDFTVAQMQPQNEAGAAASMTIDYLAAIDGTHELDDDTVVEVGVISTSNTQFNSPATGTGLYSRIEFDYDFFSASPVTMLQIQTSNSESINPSNPSVPWMTVAAEQVNADELDVALERAEVNDGGSVSSEDIAYFALDPNIQGTFLPGDGSTILFETLRPTNIEGVDNGCDTATYVNTYASTPRVIASQSTRNGGNGGWAKRCSNNLSAIGLQIDEDRFNDTERAHIAEDVDVLVWSAGFAGDFATPDLDIVYTSDVAVQEPGAPVNYTVTVTNNGNTNAVDPLLNAEVSPFAGLVMDAFVTTPFDFLDGGSGLIPGSPEYSQDNGVDLFGYSPGTTGTDTTITDWRIPFTGSMPSGSSYVINYRLEVD